MSQLIMPPMPVSLKLSYEPSAESWTMQKLKNDYRFDPPGFWGLRSGDVNDYLIALMRVRSPEEALGFLGQYGSPFSSRPGEGDLTRPELPSNLLPETFVGSQIRRLWVKWSEIQALQQDLTNAIKGPIQSWIGRLDGMFLTLKVDAEKLRYELEHEDAAALCFAEIFLERFSGREFGWCERLDCGKFYMCESKHQRYYCSLSCAHLVAVRRNRQKKVVRKRNKAKPARGRDTLRTTRDSRDADENT